MGASARVVPTPKCPRVWLENDRRPNLSLSITSGCPKAVNRHLLSFFVILSSAMM